MRLNKNNAFFHWQVGHILTYLLRLDGHFHFLSFTTSLLSLSISSHWVKSPLITLLKLPQAEVRNFWIVQLLHINFQSSLTNGYSHAGLNIFYLLFFNISIQVTSDND